MCKTGAMYAIVAFCESDYVDWVPTKWITTSSGEELQETTSTLADKQTVVRVCWPPVANPSSVSRARNRCINRETNWPSYDCTIWGTASE